MAKLRGFPKMETNKIMVELCELLCANKGNFNSHSKLTIKRPKQRHWHGSGVFIVNFEHISQALSLFLLLTLNKYMPTGQVFNAQRPKVIRLIINPFHATSLFLHPLKTSENQSFSAFRGYRKRPVAWKMFNSKPTVWHDFDLFAFEVCTLI